ncbi:hypothetical protein R5W23_002871 [Gemmata sp. JC673]|uniref:SHOCT domain-containing protein n=1 Tax=Gemmata algarum TaxID=2975278 RepID=A0ABU5F378_9BACT|nr:hypothetical protein [Gemmata algarum]MDY3561593.1 hypothetical protein [Gemmata algarum]
MWALAFLAAEGAADDPLSRPELLYGIAGLVLALLGGAIAISLADRWRKRSAAPVGVDETDMLTTYRDMYEHGELTDGEYAELRRRVAEKVKNMPVPAKPPAPDPSGRPDPAKLAPPAPPAAGGRLDPDAPTVPTELPPPAGTA